MSDAELIEMALRKARASLSLPHQKVLCQAIADEIANLLKTREAVEDNIR